MWYNGLLSYHRKLRLHHVDRKFLLRKAKKKAIFILPKHFKGIKYAETRCANKVAVRTQIIEVWCMMQDCENYNTSNAKNNSHITTSKTPKSRFSQVYILHGEYFIPIFLFFHVYYAFTVEWFKNYIYELKAWWENNWPRAHNSLRISTSVIVLKVSIMMICYADVIIYKNIC